MQENVRVFALAGTLIEYLPSASVVVTALVPSAITTTPARGASLSSTTVPATFDVCANNAVAAITEINETSNSAENLISLLFIELIDWLLILG
jgi:hypothetical protein